jgi:RimJ/RimL family protein N-acetyltransferase
MGDIDRVEIHHDEANLASAEIARRAGFRHVETTPDRASAPAEIGIEWIWRMTRHEWLAQVT